jgi:hypothetical protein
LIYQKGEYLFQFAVFLTNKVRAGLRELKRQLFAADFLDYFLPARRISVTVFNVLAIFKRSKYIGSFN